MSLLLIDADYIVFDKIERMALLIPEPVSHQKSSRLFTSLTVCLLIV